MLSKNFRLKLNLDSNMNSINQIFLYDLNKKLFFSCMLPHDTSFKAHKIYDNFFPFEKNIYYISEEIFFKILGEFNYVGTNDLKIFFKENGLEELMI